MQVRQCFVEGCLPGLVANMNVLLAVVLSVSVIVSAEANGVIVEVRNVIWKYDPSLQNLSAGDVVDANPTIDLELNNTNAEPAEIWISCKMKGHQNWARSHAKAQVVIQAKTAKAFQLNHCHLLLHTPKRGVYDLWMYIQVSKSVREGNDWVKEHLGNTSKSTSFQVSQGNFRDMCNQPAGPKSDIHIMPSLTGPSKTLVGIVNVFTIHENFTFWNTYDHELMVPYRYRVKDQAKNGIEGKFKIIIPAKCHGRIHWWKTLLYTYYQARPYEFFGWAAACLPYKYKSVCKKFHHRVDVAQ